MNPAALRRVHLLAASVALLTIGTFWMSTVLVELLGSPDAIVAVKRSIPWGLLILVPAMAATAITGSRLTRELSEPAARRIAIRMRVIGILGILVLVPCVLFLGLTASPDRLGTTFYAVQIVELIAGAANIILLSLNIRAASRLRGFPDGGGRIGQPGAASLTASHRDSEL